MFDVIFENVHILFYVNLCFAYHNPLSSLSSLSSFVLFRLSPYFPPVYSFPSLLYVFNLLVSLSFIIFIQHSSSSHFSHIFVGIFLFSPINVSFFPLSTILFSISTLNSPLSFFICTLTGKIVSYRA
uniref:Uncharacterized protein n=1 Tax=Cacopsylla melanoneura TaxID=428564 RepID=A0A8D8T3B7_9HEMI